MTIASVHVPPLVSFRSREILLNSANSPTVYFLGVDLDSSPEVPGIFGLRNSKSSLSHDLVRGLTSISYSLSTVARQSAIETPGAAHLGSTVQEAGMSWGAGFIAAADASPIEAEQITNAKRRQDDIRNAILSAIALPIVEGV